MLNPSRLPIFVVIYFAIIATILLVHPSQPIVAQAADKAPDVAETAKIQELPLLPPGTVVHIAKGGDTVPGLVRTYLWTSKYMTASEFEAAIRQANSDLRGIFLKPGDKVVIPGIEEISTEKMISVPRDYEVRAVYLTGSMAASERGINIVRQWRKVGGNAVVFDIKDSDGWVNIDFNHKLVPPGHRPPIRNLAKYTRFLHSQGMHAIARIAIFRDEALVKFHPELAVRSRKTGQAWRENGKLVWTDPSNKEVQAYNIALARKAVELGVDEIQFDYVRFPAEGDQKDAKFAFETANTTWKRKDAITNFVKDAYGELHPTGVLLSLDVFGVVAWQRSVDLASTGQDIPEMAKYCDVLSPMIYPSHFFGMDGYALPGDAPEHFIGTSMDRFRLITKGTGVVLRPWLQAFAWKTKTYSPQYIKAQVATSKSKGGVGFLFWNARNDYSKPYIAMPEMLKDSEKFFRGDEHAKLVEPGATANSGK